MSLAIRIAHAHARVIQERVTEIKNNTSAADLPLRRQQLRLFAELVVGTLDKLIDMKLKDGKSMHECNSEEKAFVRRLKLIRDDIHTMLDSVNCDI